MVAEANTEIPFSLDHNAQLLIQVELGEIDEEFRDIQLKINLDSLAKPEKLASNDGHFPNGLRLLALRPNQPEEELPITPRYNAASRELLLEGSIPRDVTNYALTLYGQPIVHMQQKGNTLVPDKNFLNHRPLCR